jgi:hypothetical protein
MNEYERMLLQKKLWENSARRCRPVIASQLAEALDCPPEILLFQDFERTKVAEQLFSEGVSRTEEIRFPDRLTTVSTLNSFFSGLRCNVALLVDGFNECGVLDINLDVIISRLDSLLIVQHEVLRYTSWDGKVGACIVVQEGTAPYFPRYAHLWK